MKPCLRIYSVVSGLAMLPAIILLIATPASANNPPNPPNLQFPANGSVDTNLQLFMYWIATDPDNDDVVCDLYFGTSSPPPLTETNITFPLRRSAPLQVATTYHWQVVVRDEHGAQTVGPEWTFTTKATNTPPEVPHYPYPPHNSTTASTTSELFWTSDDPDGLDIFYDVYFGTTVPPPLVETIVHDGSEGHYHYFDLPFTTTYYWQIVARDPQGAITNGPIWTFTTKANSPPNLPEYPQPPHNGIGSSSPVLEWSVDDVDAQPLSFDVYFGPTNPPPLVATSLTAPGFEPGDLQPNVVYYWKIVASDGFLTTTGPIWSFGARQAGDIVHDGVLTPADAACAMEMYMWNPACATTNQEVADADCSANITPDDARCIHREAVGIGCDICDQAIAAAPQEETIGPVVSLGSWVIDGNVLVIRVAVTGAPTFNVFGCYATASSSIPLIEARRRGASNNFDVLLGRQVAPTYAFVGGYALQDQPAPVSGAEFIELRFDVSGGIPNTLIIDGFVDDLANANALVLQLNTMVDAGPIPTQLALHQNYPNPFNPRTTIAYDLPATSAEERAQLRIIDVNGRVVRTLVDENQRGGTYRVEWEGKNSRGESVSSGIYFSVLDARGARQTRKLLLLK